MKLLVSIEFDGVQLDPSFDLHPLFLVGFDLLPDQLDLFDFGLGLEFDEFTLTFEYATNKN